MKTKINISNDERTGVETMNVEQLERELEYKIAKYEQLKQEAMNVNNLINLIAKAWYDEIIKIGIVFGLIATLVIIGGGYEW